MQNELLNRQAVQDILGISRQTLITYQKKYGFPTPIRIGPQTQRWRRSEIEAWLDSRKARSGSADQAA